MINAAFGCSHPNVVAASFDEFSGPFQSWFGRLTGNNADASDVCSDYGAGHITSSFYISSLAQQPGSKRVGQCGHLLPDKGISSSLGDQLRLRRLLFRALVVLLIAQLESGLKSRHARPHALARMTPPRPFRTYKRPAHPHGWGQQSPGEL
jgi:hypothetical protein